QDPWRTSSMPRTVTSSGRSKSPPRWVPARCRARHNSRQRSSMCYVIQTTAPGTGGVDGQEEDKGQSDEERRSEEGHQDCQCQPQDREGRDAGPAGFGDLPSEARGSGTRRVAGKYRPPPRLVAVSLLDALMPNRIARARPPRVTPGIIGGRAARGCKAGGRFL